MEPQAVKNHKEVILNQVQRIQERFLHGMDVLTSNMDLEVGTTPKELVYEEDKVKMYHYTPVVKERYSPPVLMVYALVNKQYMLDLQPDRSVIRNLLSHGIDVYIIDWGYPSPGDKYLTMEDYIDGYLSNCVDFVCKEANVKQINLMGICQGGTFSVIYSALNPEKVKNLITTVAPIDFDTKDGLLHVWSYYLDIDKMVDVLGNIPGDFMNIGFLLLNPFRLIFDKYVNFLEHIDDKAFVSNFIKMEKWIFDSPDQAGEAFRKFIKDMYQNNLLVKNEFQLGGKTVDLRNITMPVLNVFGENDHLVPPAASRPLIDLIRSKDKENYSFPTGHIGIFVSSRSQKELCPKVASWLKKRSTLLKSGQEKQKKDIKKGRKRG
ncbi:MAG: class III poly(R)-hydroxyalkanoic acid synthase subunit PhaC [Planctomycetota bacterium]